MTLASPLRKVASKLMAKVGVITKGGEYDPETGEVITPPKVLSGWHVNYAGEPPEAWSEYLVTPQHPVRVWA